MSTCMPTAVYTMCIFIHSMHVYINTPSSKWMNALGSFLLKFNGCLLGISL